MKDFNVVEILGYGVMGLGFLLAFFAYRLLLKEQKKEPPRSQILRSIYFYMTFSIVLCGIGFAAELVHTQRLSLQAIDEGRYYMDFFRKYQNDVAELAGKAEILIKGPNVKEQELVKAEIQGIVNTVRKERGRSEQFRDQLDGEIEKIANALSTGDAKSINRAIIVLYKSLPYKNENLRKALKRIQESTSQEPHEQGGFGRSGFGGLKR
jgi:hypothetical protein